ncbi:hypothetical protein PTKIN_Ptkin13bG0152700 [Pterospermum kingtungense]
MALQVDDLTNQIFSVLENRFLFGYDENRDNVNAIDNQQYMNKSGTGTGKVRILSIDSGSFSDGILSAQSLVSLQAFLRLKSGNPNAAIADYFDLAAGSGAGGILAALLFTRGQNGAPIFSADEALHFLVKNRRKLFPSSSQGIFRRVLGASKRAQSEKLLTKTFGDLTLKDTLKPILIPCYDISSHAPFVFSRADAMEMDGYDFKMKDVCLATSADPTVKGAVETRSVDERSTKIVAVEGGVAMNNPTAAAMTHVLNNKQEFPFCNGVDDILVLSLGNGESDFGTRASPKPRFLRIAGEGASDMVDQAVSMAFAECGGSSSNNYVRIQGNIGFINNNKISERSDDVEMMMMSITKEMLGQRNVESHLFKGKKMSEVTNMEKLEMIGGALIKEHQRRKTSIFPTVVLKQLHYPTTPRTSSASASTSISTRSSSSSSSPSPRC